MLRQESQCICRLNPSPDENRERIIAKLDLSFLVAKLGDDNQVNLAIAVLGNLCFDYGTSMSPFLPFLAHVH